MNQTAPTIEVSARRRAVHRLSRSTPTDRRADTQRRLLEAGRTVIAEHGVGGASVGLITSAAGFTRGAFYSNFSDMDHFVQQVAENEWQSILNRIGTTLRATLVPTAALAPHPIDEADPALVNGEGTPAAHPTHQRGAAAQVAAALARTTQPLLEAEHSPDYSERLTTFARALLAAVPRDREFYLLWASLANFMVRYPQDSANLRESFEDFRTGMAQYVVWALDTLDLQASIEALDLIDLIIAIGTRSTRASLVGSGADEPELIDRLLPQLLPMLATPKSVVERA